VSTEALGDLAERVAQQLTVDTSLPVEEASAITEEAVLSDNNLLHKIRFSWKPEDRTALDRIRIAASASFDQAFADAIDALDWFYLQLRVPAVREDGQVITDAEGRTVWQKDELERPLESWSQITGDDLEKTLVDLDRIKLVVAPQVNELMLEALYARHSAQDAFDDAWGGTMDGTQGDRTARSNRESRQDRYHAFFRFYLYSQAKVFLDELTMFQKRLNNVRYWQINSQK
jgi:hypothetical protein